MMGKGYCWVRAGGSKAGGNEVMTEWVHEVEETRRAVGVPPC